MSATLYNVLVTFVGILVPVLTGYLTQALVGLTKKIDAFDAASPLLKQVVSFVYAAIPSLILAAFGTSDIGIILNTLIGGGLAQLFHNGAKVQVLPPALPLTAPSVNSAESASGSGVTGSATQKV